LKPKKNSYHKIKSLFTNIDCGFLTKKKLEIKIIEGALFAREQARCQLNTVMKTHQDINNKSEEDVEFKFSKGLPIRCKLNEFL
jgi:4-diphosphocytidyl-2C-methyl-D-erythritol kinase